MYKAFLVVSVTIALTGCVVAWGGTYSIETQTPDSVTIKYDGNFMTPEKIQKVAQATCEGYGKNAVKQEESTSVWRLTTVSFLCAKR